MSRTRTQNTSPTSVTVTINGSRYAGTSGNPTYNYPISAQTTYQAGKTVGDSMTDEVVPMFKSRVMNGEIFSNAMTHSVITDVAPVPTAYNRALVTTYLGKLSGDVWSGSWPITSGELGSFIIPSQDAGWNADVESLVSKAVTESHARVSANEMMILATAGELDKTIASLGSILMRVTSIVLAARRADLKYLKRQISWKELSDRWMEVRYALRPLGYDVRGILRGIKAKSAHTRETARASDALSWYKEDTYNVYGSGSGYNATIKRTVTVTTSVRAGVLFDLEKSALNIWGADKIFETAWELLPLSFIIDWFFNVGSTIAAWTPDVGIRELASWSTVKHSSIAVNSLVSISNASSPNYRNEFSWSGEKSHSEIWTIRKPNPALGLLPSRRIRLDASKLLDLVIIGRKRLVNVI